MRKLDRDSVEPRTVQPSRRSRIEALLFAGAALATTALTLRALSEPKTPPFRGE